MRRLSRLALPALVLGVGWFLLWATPAAAGAWHTNAAALPRDATTTPQSTGGGAVNTPTVTVGGANPGTGGTPTSGNAPGTPCLHVKANGNDTGCLPGGAQATLASVAGAPLDIVGENWGDGSVTLQICPNGNCAASKMLTAQATQGHFARTVADPGVGTYTITAQDGQQSIAITLTLVRAGHSPGKAGGIALPVGGALIAALLSLLVFFASGLRAGTARPAGE
jgi:hypothetical protein